MISAYSLAGHGYRRLPAGWHERQDKRDFQRRQDAAAERAQAHGLDAPPPGYTYVVPFQRAVVASSDTMEAPQPQARRVQARGLFTLMLGLRRNREG
ncbi:MAG: hypothetical protein AB4911_06005 [Oscillochloridaceae bacterium umkhey_bin13]